MEKQLSILITTYNRKERLALVLHEIESQGLYDKYDVIISDNHSDYNVKEYIAKNFKKEFADIVHVNSWSFNTGMSTNISMCFTLIKTKWCLFLSDDDEVIDGFISKILSDIKTYSNVGAIKYSIEGSTIHENRTINDIDEYINYYKNKPKDDAIYLSMVYNMEVLQPHFWMITSYSYTYISFLIPVLQNIINKEGGLRFSSHKMYRYKSNSDGWNGNPKRFLKTMLGIRTFFDIDFSVSDECRKGIYKTVCYLLSPQYFLKQILQIEDKSERRRYFNSLRPYCLRDNTKWRYLLRYYVYHFLNFDIRDIIKR
jgi:hypothetical protein